MTTLAVLAYDAVVAVEMLPDTDPATIAKDAVPLLTAGLKNKNEAVLA